MLSKDAKQVIQAAVIAFVVIMGVGAYSFYSCQSHLAKPTTEELLKEYHVNEASIELTCAEVGYRYAQCGYSWESVSNIIVSVQEKVK